MPDQNTNSQTTGNATLDRLLNSKDMRLPIMRELAKDNPGAYVPEIEVADRIAKVEADANARVEKIETERAQEKALAAASSARNAAIDAHHLSAEQVVAVEKKMVEGKTASYETGLALMELEASKAAKTHPESRTEFSMPDRKANQTLYSDHRRYRRERLRAELGALREAENI